MYINTNLGAMQAYSNVVSTNQLMTQYQGELSSGLAINNPSQNPADYAISQQMQNQVLGLNQASQNIQAGVSLIQTATGTLTQIENILQSMGQLANQAANTGMQPSNLASIQSQMDQYAKEITGLTNTTQYNGMYIMTGQYGSQNTSGASLGTNQLTVQTGANQGNNENFTINASDAYTLGISRSVASGTTQFANGTAGTVSTVSIAQNNQSILLTGATSNATVAQASINIALVGGVTVAQLFVNGKQLGGNTSIGTNTNFTGLVGSTGEGLQVTGLDATALGTITAGTINFTSSTSVSFTSSGYVNAESITAGGPLVNSTANAQQAITTIQTAIQAVNSQLGYLGSIQNRLNFTNNGVTNQSQNLTQAQGIMVDANIPQVESQFQQQQILLQSGIAMAAQANMQPSYLLKLIQ